MFNFIFVTNENVTTVTVSVGVVQGNKIVGSTWISRGSLRWPVLFWQLGHLENRTSGYGLREKLYFGGKEPNCFLILSLPISPSPKVSWSEYPTLAVAINTAYYLIINALHVFSHDIFDLNLYTYLCQKIYPFQLNVWFPRRPSILKCIRVIRGSCFPFLYNPCHLCNPWFLSFKWNNSASLTICH